MKNHYSWDGTMMELDIEELIHGFCSSVIFQSSFTSKIHDNYKLYATYNRDIIARAVYRWNLMNVIYGATEYWNNYAQMRFTIILLSPINDQLYSIWGPLVSCHYKINEL